MKIFIIMSLLLSVIIIPQAFADREWISGGTHKAGGEAKEIKVNQAISKVVITCTEGQVTISSLTLKDGGKSIPFQFMTRLNKGESQQVTVGDKIHAGSIIINDDGRGEYSVRIKK
ncbi:MAG TPA: hypothetical protein PJ991_00090 [Kiritimatiellia bacterium]|nr:hypothetical protein [Kiritimatiellia bacterium]